MQQNGHGRTNWRRTAPRVAWALAGWLAGCRRDVPATRETAAAPPASCENTYLPVHPGASWTYEVTYTGLPTPDDAGQVTGRFIQRVSGVHPGGFTLEQQWPYATQTIPWACRPTGLLALERGGETTQSDREGHGSMTFRTESVEGVNLPSPLPAPGGSWQVVYRIRGSGHTRAGALVDSMAVYASTYTVGPQEAVTVRGQGYQTVRIGVLTTLRTDVTASDRPGRVHTVLTEEGSSWYAAGLGWVRSALRSHGDRSPPVESVTELVRYDPSR